MYEFIKEKEIEKIILEHMITGRTIEEKCKELLKRVYEQTVARILLQVKLHFESNNHFKDIECLYDEVTQLKEQYTKYIEAHHITDIESDYARETLNGVIKAISHAAEEIQEEKENPLVYERMLFVSTAILKLKDQLNKVEDEVLLKFKLPNNIHIDFTKLITNHLLVEFENAHGQLDKMISEAVIEFNNIEKRPELKSYIRMLEDEQKMLSNFIHIDLEIGDNTISKDVVERLMNEYIVQIREMHKGIDESLARVNIVLEEEVKVRTSNINNIESIIEANILNDVKIKELMEIVELDKNNTIDMVITHVNDELNKVSKSEVRKIKKASSKFELLSCVILEVFEMGLSKLSKVKIEGIEDDTERMIAKGVMDTLHLKYDALKEKDADYHLKKKEEYLSYSESFLRFKDEFESKCEEYLEESINGDNDGFIIASERFAKLVSRESEENLLKDLSYVREDMLFEVITLEDMINQSIRKLDESENENACIFAEKVNELFENVIYQLKRHDIIQLVPKSGESFNGKIHEVVITDKEEGYQKGDIIRVQNSGFIYENRILKRAAVIVAK